MKEKPVIVFSYSISDILEEVTKRTSYYGKMRGTEQEPLMIDRLSLTRGENFMFTEFIEDAASNVYDWLKAFGRSIKHAYHAKCIYEESVQYKNHGAYLTIDNEEAEMGKSYVFKKLDIPANQEVGKISVIAPLIEVDSKTEDVNINIEYKFYIHTLLDGTLEVDERYVHNVSSVLSKGEVYEPVTIEGNRVTFPFDFNESGSVHKLQSVDVEITVKESPVNIEPIKAETYVEYHPNLLDLSAADYYQVVKDCTNANWLANADELPADPREKIMLVLEQTDYFDVNMIHSIDRNIKEALVNYIIYRWFEFVYPAEEEKFYLKYEDYAHKAQLGMNSETKPIQRRYKLF